MIIVSTGNSTTDSLSPDIKSVVPRRRRSFGETTASNHTTPATSVENLYKKAILSPPQSAKNKETIAESNYIIYIYLKAYLFLNLHNLYYRCITRSANRKTVY